jgi:hypothetical protein
MNDGRDNQSASDTRESFAAIDRRSYPRHTPVWSEILPGLWQGGTLDADKHQQYAVPLISKREFDSVFTLYAHANPVDWFVKEFRFGFMDSDDTEFDTALLKRVVALAHGDWKRGEKVLIRCQAGLNRSGIITALVLIRDGHSPSEAISLMREKRNDWVLFNPHFEKWILKQSPQEWQD